MDLFPAAAMPDGCSFLSLPRELRDIIYRIYLHEPDGYHFNYDLGKLQASQQPIDLNLMYTCTTVAAEMHGLALEMNTITFSTVYSESERVKAGHFGELLQAVSTIEYKAFGALYWPENQSLATPDFFAELARKFPQLVEELSPWTYNWMRWDDDRAERVATFNTYQAPSTERAFKRYALQLLMKKPDFVERSFIRPRPLRYEKLPCELRGFYDLHLDPWSIPSEEEFAIMTKDLPSKDRGDRKHAGFWFPENEELWQRIRFRFSAAAVAIKFLNSIPSVTRVHIRKILLNEDHEAIGYPACHALGLIPFGIENVHLHIERRVNLWRNILPGGHECVSRMIDSWGSDKDYSLCQAKYITPIICTWIKEAFALFEAGMPPGSFSFMFDGEPTPDRSSQVFQVVQQDAAWQSALSKYYLSKSLTPQYHEMYSTECYFFEEFPRWIDEIVEGSSFIGCNFPIKEPPDADEILEANYRSPVGAAWKENLCLSRPKHFQTSPPLPKWIDMRYERLISDDFDEAGWEDEKAQLSLSYFEESIVGLWGEY